MKMKQSDGSTYHKLGDIRITGPEEEVKAFLEWIVNQNCYVYGCDDLLARRGVKGIDLSIDIYSGEKNEDPTLKRGRGYE
jgi:hypothetical protein